MRMFLEENNLVNSWHYELLVIFVAFILTAKEKTVNVFTVWGLQEKDARGT